MRYVLYDKTTGQKITLEHPFDLTPESIAKEIYDKQILDDNIIEFLIKEKGFIIISNK